ncbi:MAG: G5 domain-containing protein [Clostridia bacterium]|nr:G5 domain-containing protein [Clostridia bacterium]
MLEKIKYFFANLKSGKMRAVCAVILAAATTAVGALLLESVNTISVFDGDNTFVIHTLNANLSSAMANFNLKSDNYDILNIERKNNRTSVEIAYTFPVYITMGNSTEEVQISGGTVSDALLKAGFTPDENDMVEPGLDTEIKETVYIDYMNVDFVSDSRTETIPCTINTVYSDKYAAGTSKLIPGTDGTKIVTVYSKYVNGNLVESTVVNEETVTNAVDGTKIIGTAVSGEPAQAVMSSADVKAVSTISPSSAIALDTNGNPVNYKSKTIVRATAYTYTGHNCATGVAPRPGYIAVNPNVIPYGTRLYIKTADGSFVYGYAIAADTGGFIRNHPTGIDLFMSTQSACTSFGVRNVEVYVLS